jgi:DNA-binding transcriptional MerR regulator
LYISIEELAEHLAVSVSTIRTWLKSGLFSKDAFFAVNTVYRFKLEVVLEELHSANLAKEKQGLSTEIKLDETTDINHLVAYDYEALVTDLFKSMYNTYEKLSQTSDIIDDIVNELSLEIRDYSNEIAEIEDSLLSEPWNDLASILKNHNFSEVIDGIRAHVLDSYSDNDDRAKLLDELGILGDVSVIQKSLTFELEEYRSKEHSLQKRLQKRILDRLKLSPEKIKILRFYVDDIHEELFQLMLNTSADIPSQKTQDILELRRSMFSNLVNFNTGDVADELWSEIRKNS